MANEAEKSLLQQPLATISNRLMMSFIENELIKISNFKVERLAPSAYQLSPFKIRLRNDDEEGLGPEERVFFLKDKVKHLRPGEYAIVSPEERISLSEGFIADFYASSWCIDKRLVLTAGRLDANYQGDLVFGLFNAGRVDVELSSATQIARVTFSWLGADNMPQYAGKIPGAYNRKYQELREKEKELEEASAVLERQRTQIEAMRKALDTQAEAD